MLKASKNGLFEKLFSIYNRNLFKRRFHSLSVFGLNHLLNKNTQLPLIIYCNHSSWWDGLVAFEISQKADLDSYVMMEEKQLKKLFLFRLLGAFSVIRENPREAVRSINYAAEILTSFPQKTVWIFPQGEILPNDTRPIRFFNGLSMIIEKVENCSVASLSIRYEFLGHYKPQIFVRIEQPVIYEKSVRFERKIETEKLEQKLTLNLDLLKNDLLIQETDRYTKVF